MASPHPRWQRSRLATHRISPTAVTPGASLLRDDRRLGAVRARLDDLQARGRLECVAVEPHLVADGLHLAALNFRRAVRHLDDPDVAIVFLYQSVVNTADTVLHCLGYHARDFEGHKLAIALTAELVEALTGRSRSRLMATTSERLRKRRHEALYTRPGVMTADDVRTALEDCRGFLPRLWAMAGGLVGMPAAGEAAAVA
ncbi:MAG TPA: hypothetical protein VGL20_04085 [Candidatus Dormibacteraeota bacterium]